MPTATSPFSLGDKGVSHTTSYQLAQLHPQIAILVDNRTASSGEATAIAFLGGTQTKVFGQKTGGYTSANEWIQLSDGAVILLATTYLADRTKRIYREGIIPDQITEIGEAALNEAIQWLQNCDVNNYNEKNCLDKGVYLTW